MVTQEVRRGVCKDSATQLDHRAAGTRTNAPAHVELVSHGLERDVLVVVVTDGDEFVATVACGQRDKAEAIRRRRDRDVEFVGADLPGVVGDLAAGRGRALTTRERLG